MSCDLVCLCGMSFNENKINTENSLNNIIVFFCRKMFEPYKKLYFEYYNLVVTIVFLEYLKLLI
jgi:hypothetical protein